MKLDPRTKELIAVAASVGANCYPCLGWYVSKAREQGIPDDEIAEAIEVGKMVRQGAHGKMDKLASELLGQVPCTPAAVAKDNAAVLINRRFFERSTQWIPPGAFTSQCSGYSPSLV